METGQGTTEYVGLLALVAAALLSTGAVVGLDEVGAAVVKSVRTGICIVGGDICRPSDAQAAGLEPCTVNDRAEGSGATISVAWVRVGEERGWSVAERSDGSVVVTRTGDRSVGAGVGLGFEASPVGFDLGVEGKADLRLMKGEAWEFPDAASAARFIAGKSEAKPTWKFGEAGDVLTAEAGAKLAGATLTGAAATMRAAGGVRVGKGQTTLYIRSRLDTGASVWLPKHASQLAGPSTGDVMVELTLAGGDYREIAFRTAARGPAPGQAVDTVARLDLRDPVNRAVARHLLTQRLPWTKNVAADLHRLMLYTVRSGTVERSVYDVSDASGKFSMAARLGLELGVDLDQVKVQRRLVSASAWTPGSQERVREDCVM